MFTSAQQPGGSAAEGCNTSGSRTVALSDRGSTVTVVKSARRWLTVVAAVALVVLPGVVFAVPAAYAGPSATASIWTDLVNDVTTIGAGTGTIVLAADITAPAGANLTLGSGSNVTLDLNGHMLSITAAGAAAIQDTGANFTIDATGGGTVTATGAVAGGGAGIGGGVSGAGGTVTINGGTVTATGDIDGGAGIGGGLGGAGGTVTINGGTVTATGGSDGAGIGGGAAGGGGTVTINGGTVTATGDGGAAGIGACGRCQAAGGAVSIGAGATVTATGGPSSAVAVGSYNNGILGGPVPFGTVTNSGSLILVGNQTIPSGATITNTSSGVLTIDTRVGGGGSITNQGSVLFGPGAFINTPETTVSDHAYNVVYDTAGSTTSPPQQVLAASFDAAQVSLPAPPSGEVWMSAASGGVTVTSTTDLGAVFGSLTIGPSNFTAANVTLFAETSVPVTVTVSGSQTYGGTANFTATPAGTLPTGVSLSGSASCTTVNGGSSITPTLTAGGSYTIDAASCSGLSLAGPNAANYVLSLTGGTFTVHPATVAVTVSGSQTFGGSAAFSTSQSLPAGISLSGSVSCTTVNGGSSITPTLAAGGAFTIDAASCSGLSLAGAGSSDYVIAYTGGTFTVHPATVAVTVSGSQIFGGSAVFSTSQSLPAGISLSGSVACTTVNGGSSITPT